MALNGIHMVVKLQQHSSGVANAVVAETTSVSFDASAPPLETTRVSTDGYNANYMGHIMSGTIGGSYLLATDNEQFNNLFDKANAGETFDLDFYMNNYLFMTSTGVMTGLSSRGSISDALATGEYSMALNEMVPISYSTEYQAIFDAMTSKPSSSIAAAQNTFVEALVAAGVWDLLDILYVFAQESNSNGEALINWINPGTYDATETNAPGWVSLEGYTGDDATALVNSNYTPSTDAVKYLLDDSSFGIYSRTDQIEAGSDISASDVSSGDSLLQLQYASNNAGIRHNDNSTAGVVGVSDTTGFFVGNRVVSTHKQFWRNGTLISSPVRDSVSVPAGTFRFCYQTSRQYSMAFAGGGMTGDNINDCMNAFEAYMDSNGKGVI